MPRYERNLLDKQRLVVNLLLLCLIVVGIQQVRARPGASDDTTDDPSREDSDASVGKAPSALFEDALAQVFKTQPSLAHSISEYLGKFAGLNKQFKSKANKLLHDVGQKPDEAELGSPVKNVIGIMFERAKGSVMHLKNSRSSAMCPPCSLVEEDDETMHQNLELVDHDKQEGANERECADNSSRCKVFSKPVRLPCPTCPPGCMIPHECLKPDMLTCPPRPSCPPCPSSAPSRPPNNPTSLPSNKPSTTSTTTNKPTPASSTVKPSTSTSTSKAPKPTRSTTTTIDPSKPTELSTKKARTIKDEKEMDESEDEDEESERRRRKRGLGKRKGGRKSSRVESSYMKSIEENVNIFIEDGKLAEEFKETFASLNVSSSKHTTTPEGDDKLADKILHHFKDEPTTGDTANNNSTDGKLLRVIGHLLDEFKRGLLGCESCSPSKSRSTRAPSTRFFKPNRPPVIIGPTNCKPCPTCPPIGKCPFKPTCEPKTCPPCGLPPPTPKPPAGFSTTSRPSDSPSMKPPLSSTAPPRLGNSTASGRFEDNEEEEEEQLDMPSFRSRSGKSTSDVDDEHCGQAHLNPLSPDQSKPVGYVINGEAEKYGEWPSYARLRFAMGFSLGTCGGVIISPTKILTAAHCVDVNNKLNRADVYQVTVGEHDITRKDSHEKEHQVESICKSPKYKGGDDDDDNTVFDFALLNLRQPIQMNEHVQAACLPRAHRKMPPPGPKSKCYLMGAGVIKFEKTRSGQSVPSYPEIVQKLRVEPTPCKKWGFNSTTDSSRVCYTKSGSQGDSCAGDSGGPVLCLSADKKWTVMGLVSYGTANCDGDGHNNWAGVYTDVAKILKLLESTCGV